MKNLKEIAKVSFVALSVSLMISTGSMAQTENDKKDVENELSAKYTSISTHNQSKLTKKAKLGYANVDNLQNGKKENDDLNREDLKSTDLNKHIKEKEEKQKFQILQKMKKNLKKKLCLKNRIKKIQKKA